MVLRYYKRNMQFSAESFFNKRAKKEPSGSGSYRITSDDIVAGARERRFSADWGRVSPVPSELMQQVTHFVDRLAIPLIACQRYTAEFYRLGHFRIIVGVEKDKVVLHDPVSISGRFQDWPWEKLADYWRPTEGGKVTGGVGIWIAIAPITENPLLPDQPNRWRYRAWRPTIG
jgi:hypothetical protein